MLCGVAYFQLKENTDKTACTYESHSFYVRQKLIIFQRKQLVYYNQP